MAVARHPRFTVLTTIVLLVLLLASLVPGPAAAQSDDLPIFDTHLHYSQDGWGLFSAQEILAFMDQAGVYRALVSSTPDDGTLLLYALDPNRIIPVLRPYRTRADMTTWTRDGSVVAYVEERLQKGVYRGIGEFHLYGTGEASSLAPRRFADLSAEYDLVLHAHTGAAGVAELAALRSDAKVLWAHAGMSATPLTIDVLLARYPNLWVETALRTDIAPGGRLNPEWAALFTRYPDRFMIGTDTWVPSRWPQLPRYLAERIASGNAEALFRR